MRNRFYLLLLCVLGVACSSPKDIDEQSELVLSMPSPAGSNSGEPFLFTDKDSTVFLSWIERNKDEAIFKFSTLKGNQWSDPTIIATGSDWFVNWADYPMIAANGKQMMAHFLGKSGEGTFQYDIKLTTSGNSGLAWTQPYVLHDDGKKAEHGFVTLLPYGDNFLAVWLDGRNTVMEGMETMEHEGGHHGQMSLRAAILNPEGKKIKEWELDNRTCDCCQTSAAITSNGPVVIYRDRSDEEIRDMSIVRLVDGSWTAPHPIHNDNWKIAGCPVNGPRVVANGNNVAVAWFTAAKDTAQVQVVFSADGGATFGEPVRVDEGKAIGRVDIVMLSDQSSMVSWMEGTEIKATKVYSNGKMEPSMTIASSSESRSSGFPQMTKSGNQLIFAWTDDKEKNIKVARINL